MFFTIPIVINLIFIKYLYDLQKNECECSLNRYRDFILAYKIFSIILSIVYFFVNIKNTIFIIFLFLLYIINIIITLYYIYNLKKTDCKCSESFTRDLLLWFTVSDLFIIVSILLFTIIFSKKPSYKMKQKLKKK